MAFGSLYLAGHVRSAFPKQMKQYQRLAVLQRRDALSAEKRAEDSRAVCERRLQLDAYRKARTVFLFRAFRSEPDLSFFEQQAERDGKILLYPYCTDRTTMLAIRPGQDWETDRFGISAPVMEKAQVWDPGDIDLILCPCVGFDTDGRRLGMGAGYYDRFLPLCPGAYRVLTAFEAQRLGRVYTEDCDSPMDAVVTEIRASFCLRPAEAR